MRRTSPGDRGLDSASCRRSSRSPARLALAHSHHRAWAGGRCTDRRRRRSRRPSPRSTDRRAGPRTGRFGTTGTPGHGATRGGQGRSRSAGFHQARARGSAPPSTAASSLFSYACSSIATSFVVTLLLDVGLYQDSRRRSLGVFSRHHDSPAVAVHMTDYSSRALARAFASAPWARAASTRAGFASVADRRETRTERALGAGVEAIFTLSPAARPPPQAARNGRSRAKRDATGGASRRER